MMGVAAGATCTAGISDDGGVDDGGVGAGNDSAATKKKSQLMKGTRPKSTYIGELRW
jgi:hypothetical protein